MRNAVVCWGPECGQLVAQPKIGRPGRYHSPTCKQRAVRRNGGKAPSEPYPPREPGQSVIPVLTAPPPPPPPARTPRKAAKRRTVKVPAEKAPAGSPEPASAAPGASDENDTPIGGLSSPDSEAPAASVTQLHIAVTEDSTVPVTVTVHPMVAAYKADLAKIGQAGTRQGLQVVEMAEKLVSSATSPAAAANLSKELQRLMGELESQTTDARVNQDPSLVIRDRTLAKLRALGDDAAEASA